MYDEFVQTVLRVVDMLDLSYTATPTADGAGFTAHVPKDLQIFVALVPFVTEVLRQSNPAFFVRWAPLLYRHFVGLAAKFPMVSSTYRFLGATLALARKLSFFDGLTAADFPAAPPPSGPEQQTVPPDTLFADTQASGQAGMEPPAPEEDYLTDDDGTDDAGLGDMPFEARVVDPDDVAVAEAAAAQAARAGMPARAEREAAFQLLAVFLHEVRICVSSVVGD